MLGLEPVDELLESWVSGDVEVIPKSPFDFSVWCVKGIPKEEKGDQFPGDGERMEVGRKQRREERETNLLLLRSDGIRETEEGKSEVDETVLVVLEFVLPVDDLRFPKREGKG